MAKNNQINDVAISYIEQISKKCKEIRPNVVIRCTTYNHEDYIHEALEGFIIQQTSFPFVIIVHDDASTDKTAEVIKEYARKYPQIILPIYEKENQFSKNDGTFQSILNFACNETGAKYIAMCEGDDYWTNPNKLQMQVDFLESHPNYSFACHRFSIFDQRTKEWHKEYCDYLYQDHRNLEIDINLFLKYWVTQPLTAVIRKSSWDGYQLFSSKFKYSRDVHLFYYLLTRGNGISLNINAGVYRWHNGGIAIGSSNGDRIKTSYQIYKELYNYTHDPRLLSVYFNYLISYYLIETDKDIKRELYKEASYVTSPTRVLIKLLKRKIGHILRRVHLLKD